MKKLEVRLRWSPEREQIVGELAEPARGPAAFEFAANFLACGLPISPYRLPVEAGLQVLDDGFRPGIWGVFDDSLPDGWGRLLMDRAVRSAGRDPRALTPLDRLAFLGERTMGALTYHPSTETDRGPDTLDLAVLADQAREVYTGQAAEVLPELLRAGGSPGGARPKVLVGLRGTELMSGEEDLPDGFEHWLVKFGTPEDGVDSGAMEHTYMRMAEAAGIEVPPFRLFATRAGDFFGVRRFDRQLGNERRHMHTLGGLTHADFRIPSVDYDALFRVARALTGSHAASVACFRRMAFNVAAHIRDDHVKNFAFLMDEDGAWSMSPAYDLAFAWGPGGEHTMTVDGEGRSPALAHCLALADRHDIGKSTASAIVEQIDDAVSHWPEWAREAGCRTETIDDLARTHRRLR